MRTMQFDNVCHMCIYSKIYTLPEEDGLFLKRLFLPTISFGFLNAGDREWFSVKLLWSTMYCAIQMNLIWLIVISCLWVREKKLHARYKAPVLSQFDMLEISLTCLQVSISEKLVSNDETANKNVRGKINRGRWS